MENNIKTTVATVTATLGILLRHAHLAGVTDHRPVRQRVSTDTNMENQELLLCDNLNSAVPLVSTTTTYQNDTPGALPRQPWQLALSANHPLVKSHVFFNGLYCCCVGKCLQ